MKRVRPFPFDRLPRVARNQVDASRSFRAHLPLGVGSSFAELERGLGGSLQLRLVESFVARARDLEALLSGVVVRLLAPGERWGLVVIDRALAVVLASRALGIDRTVVPELPAPRPLTLAESGALELLVQLLVEEQPTQVVGVVEPDELLGLIGTLADDALVHVLEARIESSLGVGFARLVVPESIALSVSPARSSLAIARRRARLDPLVVAATLELVRSRIDGPMLAGFRIGDVVAFDVPAGSTNVALRVGRGAFAASASTDDITITSPFRLYPGADMPTDPTARTDDNGADQLLRELPLEIVCEVGRVTMNGRELLELVPGAVIPIPRALSGPVDLTVGGRLVARGELVDVEGDLGVRLTEVVD